MDSGELTPPEEGDDIVVRFPWGLRKKGKVLAKNVNGVDGVYRVQYRSCTLTDYLTLPWHYAANSPKHSKVPKPLTDATTRFVPLAMSRKRTPTNFYTVQPLRTHTPPLKKRRGSSILHVEVLSDSDDEDAADAMLMLSMNASESTDSIELANSDTTPISRTTRNAGDAVVDTLSDNVSRSEHDEDADALKRIRKVAEQICAEL